MGIVNRAWVTLENGSRVLRVSDVRDSTVYTDIDRAAAVARMGGEAAAVDYGIKAAISDAGSGGKTARDKIAAARKWLEGSPDPRAVVAEYQAQMAAMARELAELRALRESLPGRA